MGAAGRVGQESDVTAELGGTLTHRRQAYTIRHVTADTDAVVDHVYLDRRSGDHRQPASRRVGVADDVRDGLGHDAVGGDLDRSRERIGLDG